MTHNVNLCVSCVASVQIFGKTSTSNSHSGRAKTAVWALLEDFSLTPFGERLAEALSTETASHS